MIRHRTAEGLGFTLTTHFIGTPTKRDTKEESARVEDSNANAVSTQRKSEGRFPSPLAFYVAPPNVSSLADISFQHWYQRTTHAHAPNGHLRPEPFDTRFFVFNSPPE